MRYQVLISHGFEIPTEQGGKIVGPLGEFESEETEQIKEALSKGYLKEVGNGAETES